MSDFSSILRLVGPANSDERVPELSPATKGLLTVTSLLGSLVLVAIWGLVANPVGAGTSIRNAITVPMLLLVSGIVCLPIIVVFSKLFVRARGQTGSLLLGYSLGSFGGALILAATSPIVALYYHSSVWAGPVAAKASLALALVLGVFLFIRAMTRLGERNDLGPLIGRYVMGGALVLGQLAVISQLASTVDPIFEHRTRFGQGVDGLSTTHTSTPPDHSLSSEQ